MAWKFLSRFRRPPAPTRPRRLGLECLERRDTPASPAGPEFLVHDSTTGAQIQPAVAVDPAGDIVAVWVRKLNPNPYSGEDIVVRRFSPAGVPLGPEFVVNTITDWEQLHPAVATDAVGNFVVVWQSHFTDFEGGGTGYDIQARRFTAAGVPLGGEFTVNPSVTSDQTLPDVTMTLDGKFVVVWQTPVDQVREGASGTADQIFARRYDAAGAPRGGEFRIDQDFGAGQYNIEQYKPHVSADAAGDFAASWTAAWGYVNMFGAIIPDPHTTRIFVRTFDDNGLPYSDERIVFDPRTPQGTTDYSYVQDNSDVAARRDGSGFVVVYDEARLYGLPPSKDPDPFRANVYAAVLGWSGGELTSRFQVNDYDYGLQANPSVAMAGNGTFVVTWESSWAGAGRYPPQGDPSVGIYARQFTAYGAPASGDIHVNTTQDNAQVTPAIAMADDGRFIVLWDTTDNGGNHDVFGQLFNP